ncbi:Small nuclear ribonucleoprotein Sm D3 domain protein [Theileria parva strain Muguga]|uniref:Small nuclear ribonucleoprotein Sm D3 n=1 Tax=Theileria parva TaxID=5875 RepID=Q4N2J1_THEPA|nr:Small nuclear ribonucleoprotein Sm D3 domain protein [Theileria parva strain Muguga]EAN31710.1 Small nuclear ribonucleoprotein Sm D3 domain protein [Theileria parva strain Muguga]|eukprot:XP_763993.1 small nuclear ribonucleoprotein [Theileria parva strain Muguga]
MSIGAPIKLLYEGIGHVVTVELQNSNLYRGTLTNVEDNMNCLLEGVVMTMKDGRTIALEQVYLRGAQIQFMIFPDMLRHAPMFKGNPKDKSKQGVPQMGMPMRPGVPPNVPMPVMGKM